MLSPEMNGILARAGHSFIHSLTHSFILSMSLPVPGASLKLPLAQLLDSCESGQVLAPLWLAAGHQLIFLSLLWDNFPPISWQIPEPASLRADRQQILVASVLLYKRFNFAFKFQKSLRCYHLQTDSRNNQIIRKLQHNKYFNNFLLLAIKLTNKKNYSSIIFLKHLVIRPLVSHLPGTQWAL